MLCCCILTLVMYLSRRRLTRVWHVNRRTLGNNGHPRYHSPRGKAINKSSYFSHCLAKYNGMILLRCVSIRDAESLYMLLIYITTCYCFLCKYHFNLTNEGQFCPEEMVTCSLVFETRYVLQGTQQHWKVHVGKLF